MLDVIEHVEDDVAFVRDVVDGLAGPETGWVLVSVPAYQSLFSAHDRALKHYRRYSPGTSAPCSSRPASTVVARGGLFHGLLPAAGRAGPARAAPPAPSTSRDRDRCLAGRPSG